jgi:predicted TIM-barrel fold metal-dependent hydrolase
MMMFQRLIMAVICLLGMVFSEVFYLPTILNAQDASSESATAPSSVASGSSAERTASLVVAQSKISGACFPVVDVHTHFFIKGKHDQQLLDRYVEIMDRNRIAVSISLDGQLGNQLQTHTNYLWTKYPDRFAIFANIDFRGRGIEDDPSSWVCNQDAFVFESVAALRAQVKQGNICGLKFFKDFGLRWKNADGSLIRIDDPRWDPIWEVCGELGIPILMHTADPSAFFRPLDESNERIGELRSRPEWAFVGPDFPLRESLHQARNRVIAKHPKTIFIAAHFGNDAENLSELSEWLDEYPNLYVEFSSRINELGRQPYTARRFFEKHQDRILLGTDGPFPEQRLVIYWRFLETFDEYFHYSEKSPPPQGDWRIYGIGLSPQILEKVYSINACRIIPGLKAKVQAFGTGKGTRPAGND